ncbi:aminopeptidase N-like [Ptychodera flava]|uniref:aminopeptidase N-like n=1 Tax=Ptychodera flava TaxID=63121 RepID=UPI00396A3480
MPKSHMENGDANTYESVKESNTRSGCHVSVIGWVGIMVLVTLLITAAVLTTYFSTGCETAEPIEDNPHDGLPPPPEDAEIDRELFDGYLSTDLIPSHYDVSLKTYLDADDGPRQFSFEGNVVIEITCQNPTSRVVLHAHETLIVDHDSVVVTTASGEILKHSNIQEDVKYEYIEIDLGVDNELTSGETYSVHMSFAGTLLHDDFMGYYLSNYTKHGETRHMAASQLETVNARRVFPCFDEPTFKATFQFTLIHRNTRLALWNMPMTHSVTDETGLWNTTFFEKTNVVMSTYLLAIVIADYVSIDETTDNDVLLRVWADKDDIHAAKYCIETASKQLTFFENFWQISYPLPKLDIVAVPDFYFGAMENWGLILTRSDYFLYDSERQSPSIKWSIASINSHEIAHKWFGNLVTTKWWDHIWLNEGLTSYYEHVGCQSATPEFETFDQLYQRDDLFRAFAADAKGSSHPVVVPGLGWPDETWFLFDRLGYEKGSSLARMMEQFLGKETLKEGLYNYLMENAYGNVLSDDLFTTLTETDKGRKNYDVKRIMDTWILQMGYPVIDVTVRFNSDDQTALIHTTQQHFLLDPDDKPDDKYTNFGYKWYVPLTYTHSGRLDFVNPMETWQNMGPVDFEISGINENDFILVNVNQTGYYRVNYDIENWNKIAEQLVLDHTTFTITNRAGFIEDAFNIGHAQLQGQIIAWKLTQYLVNEKEYNPWNTALNNIRYTDNMLKGKSTYGYMERYIRRLVTPLYEIHGWDFSSEDYLTYQKTVNALQTACLHGNDDCIEHSSQLYSRWMNDPNNNTIPYYLKTVVYCTAIRHGSNSEWDFAWRMLYDGNTTNDDISHLQAAMACTKDTWRILSYLETALGQLWAYEAITYALYNSQLGHQIAWTFTIDNFELLLQMYKELAYDIVWQFADFMNTEKDKEQLEDFGKEHRDMPSNAAADFYNALHKVDLNIRWMTKNEADLFNWFRDVAV